MVGPSRPQFVLFGSSIVQLSFLKDGWGAILSHLYSRKVLLHLSSSLNVNYYDRVDFFSFMFSEIHTY